MLRKASGLLPPLCVALGLYRWRASRCVAPYIERGRYAEVVT